MKTFLVHWRVTRQKDSLVANFKSYVIAPTQSEATEKITEKYEEAGVIITFHGIKQIKESQLVHSWKLEPKMLSSSQQQVCLSSQTEA